MLKWYIASQAQYLKKISEKYLRKITQWKYLIKKSYYLHVLLNFTNMAVQAQNVQNVDLQNDQVSGSNATQGKT